MLVALYKFVALPNEIKAQNRINSKCRLDCIKYAGNYIGLTNFVNDKGQLFFYKSACREVVDTHSKRYAEWCLTNKSQNLSSIYIEDVDFLQFGYGFPNGKPRLSNGQSNPMYPFRNDAFLFIVNQDYTEIEVLVLANGRNYINLYYQSLIDGDLDAEIERYRANYRTYFDYNGFVGCL